MIAYHGSKEYGVFKKFRKSKSGYLGPGIYFTTDKARAKGYATKYQVGNLYTCELDVKNPLIIQDISNPASEILTPSMRRRREAENSNCCFWIKTSDLKKLERNGYDAIIMHDEVMVFSPEQIKIMSVELVEEK